MRFDSLLSLLTKVGGVLPGSFLGASSDNIGTLTGKAFSIMALSSLDSLESSLGAAYCVGYFETITSYLVSPALRNIPVLILLVVVCLCAAAGTSGHR